VIDSTRLLEDLQSEVSTQEEIEPLIAALSAYFSKRP
jgi:hypothetical protein